MDPFMNIQLKHGGQPTINHIIINQINDGIFLTNKAVRDSSSRVFKNNAKNNTKDNQKHNVMMRKHHRIKQPGFDVQRFGGK
jgi:hypothetical protein